MDTKFRFILVYSVIVFSAYTAYVFLNQTDLGVYVSSVAVIYFALRLILNPQYRTRVDFLGLILLALFAYFVAERVLQILEPT
jgi:hypothetical protein